MRFWYFGNYPDGRYVAVGPRAQINLLVAWMLLMLAALVAIAVGVWVR